MSDNDNEQRKPGLGAPLDPAGQKGEVAPSGRVNGNGAFHGAAAGDQPGSVEDVGERDLQYMISLRRSGVAPMGFGGFGARGAPSMAEIEEALQKPSSNFTVVRRIRPSAVSVLASGGASDDILVVRRKAGGGEAFPGLHNPALIIERDHLLGHLADAGRPRVAGGVGLRPMNVMMGSTTLRFHVQDTAGRAQVNAQICLYTNAGGEALGTTDRNGDATVAVNIGYVNELSAIYVKPFADCWEKFVQRPQLQADALNIFTLHRLADFAPAGFVDPVEGARGFCGWGQRLMGLDKIGVERATGRGVKVAIIDSGCDNTHPALTHVQTGRDYTRLDERHMPDEESWTEDGMSHGTHCAGIICGSGRDGHIRGFVPEAEVHVLKLFPGGAFNNLAAALHYCIDNQIDVVNCSLGGEQTSETIEQLIDTARQAGVMVVVAAGNSGGPVQFPASAPGVLCITAIGEQGEYPDYTYHAQTHAPEAAGPGRLFMANFSCRGPQVDFCAPGVAVISSVPGGGYASWDGTSMAAPAVTGLLAMMLAHHPEFAGKPVVRDAARVNRLFQIIAQAALPLGMQRQQAGAGLPVANGAAQLAAAASEDAAQRGQGGPITQGQLEQMVRNAMIASFGSFANGGRPPAR